MTGVYDFYEQLDHFISSPISMMPKPLRIVANQGNGDVRVFGCTLAKFRSHTPMISRTQAIGFLLNDIRIYKNGETSKKIYGTIMHELGHALHWHSVGTHAYVWVLAWPAFAGKGDSNKRTLMESWASSVEVTFVRRAKYPKYEPDTQKETTEYWRRDADAYIKVIAEDLSDTVNQQVNDPRYPLDRVRGFTLYGMYISLQGANRMRDWRNNIYRSSNPTSQYLQEYFQQYDSAY